MKSHRVPESEYLINEKLLGEFVSNVCNHQTEEEDVKCISKVAAILRKEAIVQSDMSDFWLQLVLCGKIDFIG